MGRFNMRAPQLVAQRVLTDGDKTITGAGAFAAVAGTSMQFAIKKDSLVEVRVEGEWSMALVGQTHVDLEVDSTLQGGADGLTRLINNAAALLATPLSLTIFLDSLAEGTHTLSLQAKNETSDGIIAASAAICPLRITVLEHALVYPPTS